MEIDILDSQGKVSGKKALPGSVAEAKPNKHLMHEVVTAYLANQRQGTHKTLTRGLVRGGGIIHGPVPRDYRIDLPNAKVKAALHQALSVKASAGELVVSEAPKLEAAKTKNVTAWLKTLSLPQKVLLVMEKSDAKLSLATRNLKDFEILERKHLHAYQVLGAKKVVLTPEAAELLS